MAADAPVGAAGALRWRPAAFAFAPAAAPAFAPRRRTHRAGRRRPARATPAPRPPRAAADGISITELPPGGSAAPVAAPALHIETVGGAGPPAVFIHDFLTDARLFGAVLAPGSPLPALAACACFDMRGFGRSPDPSAPYDRRNDVAAAAAAVGAGAGGAPAHIVGCGLGGAVALEFALAAPDRVASVSLVSSGLPGHAWRRARRAYFRLPLLDAAAPPAGTEGERADARALAREWVEQSPEWRDALERGGRAGEALQEMYAAYSCFHFWGDDELVPDPYFDRPLADRIKRVQAPVLVMAGELEEGGDAAGDFLRIADWIAAAVPCPAHGERRVHTLRGAGHFGTLEAPSECQQLIADFWRSLV